MSMRLPEYILANVEPILADWEVFARGLWPKGSSVDVAELRDHARDILLATVADMRSSQSASQQSEKSMGRGAAGVYSDRLDSASTQHGLGRVASGFDLQALISEYRALRASVIRLWQASVPKPDLHDLEDMTRFNESIDQSLAEAVRSFTARLDQSRRMFLAILGHDLRNPISAISLNAQMLSQIHSADKESMGLSEQIASSAKTMSQMIQDLLDFTITGLAGGMPITRGPVDAGALGREVIGEMRAAHPGHELLFQQKGDLTGNWDRGRLRQLIANLVGNALQHGAENGPVSLTITDDGPMIRIAIHNQGEPIPPQKLATIFDPLVSSQPPAPRGSPGSIGLGLYIVREVARAHGGYIDVDSTLAGGTTFTAWLPRQGAASGQRP